MTGLPVVLFCGGLGMRLRDYSEEIPKPLVPIGYRPVLWHVMKYYAHFGHKDFTLCLGYKADKIKNYFLDYSECLSNDFTLSKGGQEVYLRSSDIDDWRITFADTGFSANIGMRLRAVRKYVGDSEVFLATYSDSLTDFPLPQLLDRFYDSGKIACFLAVHPRQTFHIIRTDDDGLVTELTDFNRTPMWVNGGYFVFRREIFDFIEAGEDLVEEPFQRLIAEEQLLSYRYDGFWGCMDTFKDKQTFDEMYERDEAPWEVWRDDATENSREFERELERVIDHSLVEKTC